MATDTPSHDHRCPSQVDPSDLRLLLDAAASSCLVLSEGRVQVHNDPPADDEALVVVTRDDLLAHLGNQPNEAELTTEAALLDDKIRLLGA